MIFCGCDVGSTTGKVVLMEDGKILGTSIVPSSAISEKTSEIAFEEATKENGIKLKDVAFTVGTGYGRAVIPFSNKNVSEISCHGLGAFWANPEIRTIVDIGGQDCKVIRINDMGKVEDFVMNDKCAAGTGRFLMDISKAIGLRVEELGPTSLKAEEVFEISAACSVFATSEVVSLRKQRKPIEGICAGLNMSVARRCQALVNKVGLQPAFVVSGGVSKNTGVAAFLEKLLKISITPIDVDPQLLGGIGAALFAKAAYEKQEEKAARKKQKEK
jgi:(R)-2-hydroxyacyl-CoA dehydratese activating ATPase